MITIHFLTFCDPFDQGDFFQALSAFSKDQGVTFQDHDVGVFKITVTLLRLKFLIFKIKVGLFQI